VVILLRFQGGSFYGPMVRYKDLLASLRKCIEGPTQLRSYRDIRYSSNKMRKTQNEHLSPLKVSWFWKQIVKAEDSPKKQTKTRRMLVKTNSFVRFLGESLARKKRFEIIWPLVQFSKFKNFLWVCWFLGKNLSNFVPPFENSTTRNAISSVLIFGQLFRNLE
jgi:hypothetical protein